jgi:alkylation response protein AidB-like acyl-CoA dehydrogenase
MIADAPLDAARKLAPQIRAAADEAEALREVPRKLFEAIFDAGLVHLAIPRSVGGTEVDFPTYVQVIEELGKADASTAWTINQLSIFGTYAARLRREHAVGHRQGRRDARRLPRHDSAPGLQHGLA